MKILWSGVERGVMSDFAETPHPLGREENSSLTAVNKTNYHL